MAIAFDNSANLGNTAGTALTAAYTCSGSNRLLVVQVDENQTAGGVKVSGVTYAGVAMTEFTGSPMQTGASGGRYWHMYYLVNPASGSNNVVVSVSATDGDLVNAKAMSYSGVKQTGQPDASNTGTVSSVLTQSLAVTTIADNCWLMGGFRNNGDNVVGQAGTTIRQNNGNGGIGLIDSNGAKTPAGSHSLGINWDTESSNGSMLVASFAPAPEEATQELANYAFFF